MRKHFLWLTLCLGLNACATAPRPQVPLNTAKACASWRWIGISRLGSQCPDVPGWTVRPLFPQLAPVQREPKCPDAGKSLEGDRPLDIVPTPDLIQPQCPGDWQPPDVPRPDLIRELNRFCVYEIAGWKKSLKKIPFPPTASTELVRFDQDCAALSLSEKYLDAKTWMTGSDEVLKQAGKPGTPAQTDDHRGVRLAFLDTQPTGEDVPQNQGRSPHGYTLAQIAQKLVCNQQPDGFCAAQITTRLALPILKFNAKHPKYNRIDPVRGGFLGTQSDLAMAIREEVDSWLQQRSERSQRHLVLNLALAWDGKLFGGLNGEQIADMQAGTQAVYRALQYAAGFDVLVLAAAGNQKQEPCASFGPLLPAAWEIEAPREQCCGKPEEDPAPLLYAVGGLRADGSPLPNARPGGMPQRAAYGETTVFTGSSVATAIVSSIAAVVWNTFPNYSSRQVMEALDGKVENLRGLRGLNDPQSLKADFWFRASAQTRAQMPSPDEPPDEAPPVRRLSLCTVLEEACAEERSIRGAAPPRCQFQEECGALNPVRRNLLKRNDESPVAKGSCQPWLYPQPEILPCPPCIPPEQ